MNSSWILEMHGHLPRYRMSFDLWSIMHKPSTLNHFLQIRAFALLFHLHFDFELFDSVLFVFVSCLYLSHYTIRNVSASFLNPIHHSLHWIPWLFISSLKSLIRVHHLGSWVMLNIFSWFLLLCSIKIFLYILHQYIFDSCTRNWIQTLPCVYAHEVLSGKFQIVDFCIWVWIQFQ